MKIAMIKEGDMQAFEIKMQRKIDELYNSGLSNIEIKYKPLYGITNAPQYCRLEKVYYTAMIIAR